MAHPAFLGISSRVMSTLLVGVLFAATAGVGVIVLCPFHASGPQWPRGLMANSRAQANVMLQRQAGCFVPNLGQWQHQAKFVHRSGPMTLFLEDRGWVLDLVERNAEPKAEPHQRATFGRHQAMPGDGEVDQRTRRVALKMTFEDDGAHRPKIVGEQKFAGHHNYFLGNDQSRWRTGVPLYGSVCYENLYPGIDLRLRETNGVPEYDLLLQPGADLSLVSVHVEGAKRLSIARHGSLVIETVLGPLTQPRPKTWVLNRDGSKREVVCNFTLLGPDRFGFLVPTWDGDTHLAIDPGLIWSTYLGGAQQEHAHTVSVDSTGIATLAGFTYSIDWPTTVGAYDTTHSRSSYNIFLSRVDPSKIGSAQLVYSTFLGGKGGDMARALTVDSRGVITVAGSAFSADFPTTSNAYDRSHNGRSDVFVSRLDPSKTGAAQLVYSTLLGGSGPDSSDVIHVDANGVVTVFGHTQSSNFPTTVGAFDRTFNSGSDAFVSRLDPRKTGAAQLVYSTFLGGSLHDYPSSMAVDDQGVVTVAGTTISLDYPTTSGAFKTKLQIDDAFVTRLDPRKTGAAQLVYSTLLGGTGLENGRAVSLHPTGTITVAGDTGSTDFTTTKGAYDTVHNGGFDVFVVRLDPTKTGTAQLVYSTFFGGGSNDFAAAMSVSDRGVVTVSGGTTSADIPTTSGAFDTTYNGELDAFVVRLDSTKTGTAQLVHSTYFGGSYHDFAASLSVDPSGVVTVAGTTGSKDLPTTTGAFDRTFNAYNGARDYYDAFVTRLRMGVTLYADSYELSLKQSGTQKLQIDAGTQNAGRAYAIFGSASGTSPGINLVGTHIPLNPDLYTDITVGAAVPPIWSGFRGVLDKNGEASATFNVPAKVPSSVQGFTLYHAYLVYDNSGRIYMASNPVPLKLVK